jgi:hypothetical protein
MTAIHPDLLTVSEAAEVVSPTRYVILGETREAAPASESSSPTVPALLTALENDLYARLYIRPVAEGAAPSDFLTQRDHLAALSADRRSPGMVSPSGRDRIAFGLRGALLGPAISAACGSARSFAT